MLFFLLMTIIIVYYFSQFKITTDNLQSTLTDKLNKEVEIIDIVDDEDLFVHFKTSDAMGYARLEKGLTNYHLSRIKISQLESRLSYDIYGKNIILYGDFSDVKTIEIYTIKGKVIVDTGFHDVVVIQSDLTQVSITGFMMNYKNGTTNYIRESYEISYEINSEKPYYYQPASLVYILIAVFLIITLILNSIMRKEDTFLIKWFKTKSEEMSPDPNDYSMTDTFLDR